MECMCLSMIVCAHKSVCVPIVPLEQESHLRLWSTGPFSPAPAHLPRLPVLTHPGLRAAFAAPVEKYGSVPHRTAPQCTVPFCDIHVCIPFISSVKPGQAMGRHSWSHHSCAFPVGCVSMLMYRDKQ